MENNQQDTVNVATVNAKLEELIIKDEAVLIQVENKSKSGLILDNGSTTSLKGTAMIQWTIAKVGDNVKRLQAGDIIYDVASQNTLSFLEIEGEQYVLTDMFNVKLAARKKSE